MRSLAFLILVTTSTLALATDVPIVGRYVANDADCRNDGPLVGEMAISNDALEMNELYCPRREWRPTKNGYSASCAIEANTPYQLSFSLARSGDKIVYADKDDTITLHRCP